MNWSQSTKALNKYTPWRLLTNTHCEKLSIPSSRHLYGTKWIIKALFDACTTFHQNIFLTFLIIHFYYRQHIIWSGVFTLLLLYSCFSWWNRIREPLQSWLKVLVKFVERKFQVHSILCLWNRKQVTTGGLCVVYLTIFLHILSSNPFIKWTDNMYTTRSFIRRYVITWQQFRLPIPYSWDRIACVFM